MNPQTTWYYATPTVGITLEIDTSDEISADLAYEEDYDPSTEYLACYFIMTSSKAWFFLSKDKNIITNFNEESYSDKECAEFLRYALDVDEKTDFTTLTYQATEQIDLTYTWIYEIIQYNIEFSPNYEDSLFENTYMTNLVYAYKYTLTQTTFTRDGYTFVNWNTESDGSGTSYEDEATVSNLTTTDGATVTLYAQWEEVTDLSITKVSSEDLTALSGVEFSLYELICEDETHDDDLIDVTDYDTSCWELVGEYETGDEGELTLSDLPITRTYRLVETKTVEDYLLPTGQWKIEFDYDDNLDEDEAITVDGTTLQITAISNPPALSLVDDTLYLYNTPSYDLPSTGDLGISDFYKIGIPIALMGLIIYLAKLRKTYCTRKFSHLSRRHNRRR